MPSTAVIDSGPLIGLFDQSDQYHLPACAFIKTYRGHLYSTTAVLTEVTHLLDFSVQAQLSFLQWVAAGAIILVDIQTEEINRIVALTEKYADLPMDFADASLVAIAEKLKIQHVVSIDSAFLIYRTLSGGYLENLLTL